MRVGEKSYTPCWKTERVIELAPDASVNLKTWISYDAFLALPPTLQKLYAQTIVDKYRVGAAAFGKAWEKSAARICQVFGELGITVPKRMHMEDKRAFMEFVRAGRELPAEEK